MKTEKDPDFDIDWRRHLWESLNQEVSKCWTEIGGLGGDTDVKYTMQESERIKGKITNILNGQAINAWRTKSLKINAVE